MPATSSTRTRSRPSPETLLDSYSNDDAPHALVDPPAWPGPEGTDSAAGSIPTSEDVADIDWVDDEPPSTPAELAPTRPAPAARPAPQVATPARPVAARPRPVPPASPPPLVAAAARLSWREWASVHRNPLLAVGLVLIVLGAVSVKRWRQRLEDLPRIAEIGRTEGFKKLDSGDFFAAKKILADAAAAVDAMGGRFEGADAIRQAAQEAAIFTDLVPKTLEDLVEEATTFRDVADWTAHFKSMYQGRSILVETTITSVPDPAKVASRFGDAYQILVGRGPKPEAKGRISYSGFQLFDLSQPKAGEIKLFGARLATLEFDLTENLWLFTLEPASGVFMTHTQALEAIHWPTGEPAEEVQP